MKRGTKFTLILALTLALVLMLSACGGESQEEVAGSISTTAPAGETANETTAAATEAQQRTEAPETTAAPTEETVAEGNTMSLGRIEGGTYTNEYMGFAIDLDESWVYYSAEELQEMPDNVAELFKDSELGESIGTLEQFTDMMAESAGELATMNVLYQKLGLQERIVYAAMSAEDILDATLAQSDAMIEAYTSAGIEVESMEKVTVTFLGEERPALKTVSTMQGVAYYTLQVFDFHTGQYSVTITFASFVEDKTEALAAMCYPLD